ncbi:MAG TPA: N-acetyl-1-D-myo-inositol-2-amino-2-deoxy-alpha-D-glucopyranoside deacetylase [Egibacteraceae bacterium]|jgi:mycothiol conjugate amidase Mca|nr:N-acetyl-1-D-myo-inositol-2-amino-2-deoxy-alpha-D-glucopyranoside deacetylase [Egibacteraceae bacterium]
MTAALMCVHAHPDDEAIATGGVLARAADEGLRTAVVTATGGERGEIVGEGMDADEIRPRLAEVRRDELAAALDILGAGAPRFLGYRDSGMIGAEGNDDPGSFWRAPFDEAVGRLVAEIRAFRPDVLVTYDAFGGYGHPDHLQTHRVGIVAAEACAVRGLYPEAGEPWRVRKLYLNTVPRSFVALANAELPRLGFPSPFGEETDVDLLPFGTPDEEVTATVDVRPWLARKWAAVRAHTSQIGPDSFFLNIPPELHEAAFGQEWFVRQRSTVETPPVEDDLFAGLR